MNTISGTIFHPPWAPAVRLDAALLILRLASAAVFLYHGSVILFGMGPEGFAAVMHMPAAVGALVGVAEFAGGLAMATGALLRTGAVCIIVVMLGAILLVHWPHGFDLGQGGAEYALTQLLVALALLLTGPGAYSLRGWLPRPLRSL